MDNFEQQLNELERLGMAFFQTCEEGITCPQRQATVKALLMEWNAAGQVFEASTVDVVAWQGHQDGLVQQVNELKASIDKYGKNARIAAHT